MGFWLFCACFLSTYAYNLSVQVFYPAGRQSLYLRGDQLGLNWNQGVQLNQVGKDTYAFSLNFGSNSVGTQINMKTLVNDQDWQIGHNEMVILPARDAVVKIYPFFYTNNGRYDNIYNFYSPQLKNNRNLVVYVPPSYDENPYKMNYPVLVLHDGQNLFNASTSFGGIAWMCQNTVDELINTGNMDEIIMFGLDNTGANRINEYTYSKDPQYGGGQGNVYLDFLEQTAMPWLLKNYRGNPNPAQTGILGSSLGGLISCYAGWTRTRYQKIGCMSSSFWWNNEDFNGQVMSKMPANSKDFFYLDSGNQGPGNDDVTQTTKVAQHMQQLGWKLNQNLQHYIDPGGQHSEYFWGKRFWRPMSFLYAPSFNQPL